MIADLDPGQRPRERMLRLSANALSDVELVALLLGSGRRGSSALDTAQDLLVAHGGLSGLARADSAGLSTTPGIGPAKATRVVAALALARRFGTSTDRRDTVRTPAVVVPGASAHGTPFAVREVLTETLRRGGVTLALTHRHDEDDPDPHPCDRTAADAAGRCGVRMLDHLVLTAETWTSTATGTLTGAG